MYAFAEESILANSQSCVPSMGDWEITQSCTLMTSTVISGNVMVQNNSVLIIPNGTTLTIVSGTYLIVESGSGILINPGGELIVVDNDYLDRIFPCDEIPFVRQLNDFYTKCTVDSGMVVASSDVVPDEAMFEMNRIIKKMTEKHPEVIERLNQNGIIAGVMGQSQVTTDMPEHSDLGSEWDVHRGLGATLGRPLVSAAEENLLCYPSDPFRNGQSPGESIAIHEFAHTLFEYGLVYSSSQSYWLGGFIYLSDLQSIYNQAIAQGRWEGTNAANNWTEFFANGSQFYFDAIDRPEYEFDPNREGLEQYEPDFATFLETIYVDDWRFSCPS